MGDGAETSQMSTTTYLADIGAFPTYPMDTCSAIEDKETHIARNRRSIGNKRKWNRQSMYNMIKKLFWNIIRLHHESTMSHIRWELLTWKILSP